MREICMSGLMRGRGNALPTLQPLCLNFPFANSLSEYNETQRLKDTKNVIKALSIIYTL